MGNRIAKPKQTELQQELQQEPQIQPQLQLQLQPIQDIYNYRLPDPSNYYGCELTKLNENCGYVSGTIRIGKKIKYTEIKMNQEYYVKCKIYGEPRADLVLKFINHYKLLVIAYRKRRSDSKDKHNNWYQIPPDYYMKSSWFSEKYIDIYQPPLCFHIGDILMCCTKQNLVFLPPEMWEHIQSFV